MGQNATINLKIRRDIYTALRGHLLESDGDNESACFLYCHESRHDNTTTYFPDVFVPLDKKDFSQKGKTYLQVKFGPMRNVYADFLLDKDCTCLVLCHSHPFDTSDHPRFSATDDANDRTQATWFYNELAKFQGNYKREGAGIEFLHLLVSQNGINVRKYNVASKKFEYLEKITVFTDKKLVFFSPSEPEAKNLKSEKKTENSFFSRTDSAFGGSFTRAMSALTVAVVGLGGIGSIIAEGIVRLGVKKLVLVDPDKIEDTNLNRLQGVSTADIGKHKVDVIKANLENYFKQRLDITVFKKNVISEQGVGLLKNVDVIIGAVDNHAARYILNRLAVQYLIPYLDGATIINPENDRISVKARVGVVVPSVTVCMDCSYFDYYKFEAVYDGIAPDSIKRERKKHGYIIDQAEIINPAVYPQNMAVSSLLLLELMNLVSAYKPLFSNINLNYSELAQLKRIAVDQNTARRENKMDHCMNCDYFLGKGDSISILSDDTMAVPDIDKLFGDSLNEKQGKGT